MKKFWKWLFGIGAALLVILLAAPFWGRLLWWMPRSSMFGYRGMPMGGGFFDGCGGFFGRSMFGMWAPGGGLMMLGMFILPLLLVGLVVAVVVLLMRRPQVFMQAPPAAKSCASCGKTVQAEWVVCPFCGEKQS